MDIQISVEELTRGLSRAQGIVDRKASQPILANVLLEADEGRLVLSATDLELGLRSEHPAEVNAPGRVTVPARSLLDIVRALSEPTVRLLLGENNRIEITSGRARFRIVGQAAADYPPLPEASEIEFLALPTGALAEMVEKTQYAISTDETRYNLGGVFIDGDPEYTRMVATDGHRLAMVERALGGRLGTEGGAIIPRKGVAELRRVLQEKIETVSIGFAGSNVVVKAEGLLLVMRLVDANFPDYKQVIPARAAHPLSVPTDLLISTLKRVSIVSPDRAPAVKLSLSAATLTISSENPDLGEASESIEVDYDGAELTVGFNARYLIEVLAAMGSEQVRIDLNDEFSPGVVRPEGDEGYTAVVMPMRI